MKNLLLIIAFIFMCQSRAEVRFQMPVNEKINKKNCTYKGFKLYGKIKFVESFPDIKIKFVESFADIHVKMVSSFPDECGKWQIVESFPDLKVQVVESFPDITVKLVESFPGIQ